MKKVLAIALMLLIPCAAFAMETMTVDEMAEITGQSGVAISLDDVKVFFYTQNEETWYQSAGNFTAVSGDAYNYRGALGLVRSDFGQMLYLNAMLASNAFSGASGNFSSIGTIPGLGLSSEPNMDRNYMLRFDPTASPINAAVGAFNADYMGLNEYFGFNFGNKNTAFNNPVANMDLAFDSRALTIRAVNRAEVLSLAAYYRMEGLRNGGIPGQAALTAAGYGSWIAAGGGTADQVSIAAVTIGLPTAEIHYKRGAGETLEILLSTALNPLTRVGNAGNIVTTDTWSYGKIYYGAWRDPALAGNDRQTLQARTILVLDGFIEITPLEALARPKIRY